MEKNKLIELIDYLESKSFTEENEYSYDGRIGELLNSLDIDIDYMDHYYEIQKKDIFTYSIDELRTMYTYLLRGERFCTGMIMENIKDGTILKLARRQLELTGDISEKTGLHPDK